MKPILLEKLAYTRNLCVDAIISCCHSSGMSINRRIKERRLAMGFSSHQALADAIGVSWQTVQQWEKEDGTAPNRSRIDSVAKALGVSAEWLRSGSGETVGISQSGSHLRGIKTAHQVNHDLEDAAKLLTIFAACTPAGRTFILQMAAGAEQIDIAQSDSAVTGD